jgi:hypothetical protein
MVNREALGQKIEARFVSQPKPKPSDKDLWLGSGKKRKSLSIYSVMGRRTEPVELLLPPTVSKGDKFDLSKWLPSVDNQLADECTPAACAPLLTRLQCQDLQSQGKPGVPEKNLFEEQWIYDEGRKLAGTTNGAPGLRIGDAMELFRKIGAKPENGKPSDAAFFKIQLYARVNCTKTDEVKAALRQFGPLPTSMWVGGAWFNSLGFIEEGDAGNLHHSVLLVGWTQHQGKEYWIIRNSWGPNWGQGGYAYMVPRYLERFVTDCTSAVDSRGSKDLFPANDWEKWLAKQPQWFKDAFGVNF